jgi:5'-nucleotidase
MNRRCFIINTGTFTAGTLMPGFLWSYGSDDYNVMRGAHSLTILHTNDQHSRIDPFPKNAPRHAGEGGFARRHALIQLIRKETQGRLLLLDAGDVFQGTPYFNYYGGKLEFDLMSRMGYDACTLGNHDFDNGLDGLSKAMPYARFPFVCSNYGFENTILKSRIRPYLIIRKGGIKVGIYGLGISPENLIPEKLFGPVRFMDPVAKALEMEALLYEKHQCQLIICLSHLGYKYEKESRPSDVMLALQLRYTHLIIGGHTHTFMDQPDLLTGAGGQKVIVTQAGWAGLRLGRIDFQFDEKKNVLSGRFFMEKIS